MAKLKWTNQYSVGLEAMDNQHKKLFELINDLFEAVLEGKGKKAAGDILIKLQEYGTTHFSDEEKLMKAFLFPSFDKHKKQHLIFMDKVSELLKIYEKSSQMMSLEVMNFMKEWLSNHIMIADKKYGNFIKKKAVKIKQK